MEVEERAEVEEVLVQVAGLLRHHVRVDLGVRLVLGVFLASGALPCASVGVAGVAVCFGGSSAGAACAA